MVEFTKSSLWMLLTFCKQWSRYKPEEGGQKKKKNNNLKMKRCVFFQVVISFRDHLPWCPSTTLHTGFIQYFHSSRLTLLKIGSVPHSTTCNLDLNLACWQQQANSTFKVTFFKNLLPPLVIFHYWKHSDGGESCSVKYHKVNS